MINSLERDLQEIYTEKKIFSALSEVVSTLFDNTKDFTYSLRKIFPTNTIRDMHMQLLDLPTGVIHRHADLKKTRKEDNHSVLDDVSFMEYDNTLVPLGTHISDHKDKFFVYPIQPGKEKITLNEYIVDKLPEQITVFRVLSEEEAKKFAEHGTKDIGSVHQLFRKDKTVHTSIHNISSEFIQKEGYKKVIGFDFPKEQIKHMLDSGTAEVGTYSSLFDDRDPKSPFPFDAELIVKEKGFEDLMEAYKKWSTKVNKSYLNNPFFTKKFPHEIESETQQEIIKTLDKEK